MVVDFLIIFYYVFSTLFAIGATTFSRDDNTLIICEIALCILFGWIVTPIYIGRYIAKKI